MPRDLFADPPKKQPRDLFADVAAPEGQASRDLRSTLSRYTQHPAQGQYEQMPAWQKPLQAADDIARLMAGGASMGFADKLAAGGDPQALEDERAKTAAAADRAGWAGTTAEVTGAVATPLAAARKGMTLVGEGARAIPGVKGLLARTGLMGLEGAGYGTVNAAGHDQDLLRGAVTGGILGSAGNAAGEGIASLFKGVGQMLAKPPPRQTVADLKSAGNAAYKASEDAGVIIKPQGMQSLRDNIVKDFTEHGFLPANEPGAAAVLSELEKQVGGNVTLKGLDSVRKMAGNAHIPGNNSNNKLIGQMVSRIDELIASKDPALMAGVDTAAGSKAIAEARDQWHRARKLETVEKLVKRGELVAGSTGSGGNVENATRQQVRKILTDESKGRGFTAEEKALAEKAVLGSNGQNMLRLAGKLAPTGNGLNLMLHLLGASQSGGATIPLAIGGIGAKKLAEALTGRNVEKFADLVARGGKEPVIPEHALERLSRTQKDALAGALMGGSIAAMGPQ